MSDSLKRYSSLSELLEQDLSSYEYFHSLPESIQRKLEEKDIAEFNEMQSYVQQALRKNTAE